MHPMFCLCFRNIMGNAASTAGENYSIIPAIQDTIMPHENYNQVIYFSRESNLSHRNNQYAGNATNAKRSSTDSDNAQIQVLFYLFLFKLINYFFIKRIKIKILLK